MAMIPIFTLKLDRGIQAKGVTVGTYDGVHPSLTCATDAGKVFLHHPHTAGRAEWTNERNDISFLSINKKITSLVAGRFNDESDVLFVGTSTDLHVYDIDKNRDLFYKDLPDGVSSIAVGSMGSIDETLVLCGGNCSIQGFDATGEDQYWTVTGDNVCSMCLVDITGEGTNQLIVGSEDFDLRVFHDTDLLYEFSENEAVTGLCALGPRSFAFAQSNGTIGYYMVDSKKWVKKMKQAANVIHAFDYNFDGVPELVTGWSDGRVDVRSERDGTVLFKDVFTSPIAGIVDADYRLDRTNNLIVAATDGDVRGYLPIGVVANAQLPAPSSSQNQPYYPSSMSPSTPRKAQFSASGPERSKHQSPLKANDASYAQSPKAKRANEPEAQPSPKQPRANDPNLQASAVAQSHSSPQARMAAAQVQAPNIPLAVNKAVEESILQELVQRKVDLALEIQALETQANMLAQVEAERQAQGRKGVKAPAPVLPAPAEMIFELQPIRGPSGEDCFVQVTVKTNSAFLIRCIVISCEGLFLGENLVVHPPAGSVSDTCKFPIRPMKNQPYDLQLRIMTGTKTSHCMYVQEETIGLPRFCCFKTEDASNVPPCFVRFTLNPIQLDRIKGWLQTEFLLEPEVISSVDISKIGLRDMRTSFPLVMNFTNTESYIRTNDFDLMGDLIQSMAEALKIEELSTYANVPPHVDAIKELLEKVDQQHSVRQRLTAEMADHSSFIRSLVVRAEDSRELGDLLSMKQSFLQLYDLNKDLINAYNIRCNNHTDLLGTLKIVNQYIQKAGRLRVGSAKSQVVNACRAAIKDNDIPRLIKTVINGGSD